MSLHPHSNRKIKKGYQYPYDRRNIWRRSFWAFRNLLWQNFRFLKRQRSTLKKIFIFKRPFIQYNDAWPHLKLTGLHDITFKCNRVKTRFERTSDMNDARNQRLSMSHEYSDRVIARYSEDGVVLTTYAYRDGYGPATKTPHPAEVVLSRPLCTVPYNTEIHISIVRENMMTTYSVHDRFGFEFGVSRLAQTKKPSFFQMPSGAHANNGPTSPWATSEINWEEDFKH